MSKPGGKGSKAVAGWKGAVAEGRELRPPPGQPEKIRLTVAYAERYGLSAKLPRNPAFGGSIGAFRIFRQLRTKRLLYFIQASRQDPGTHLACLISAISSKNPRQYTKYSLRFLNDLTKTMTAQSAHRNPAETPVCYLCSFEMIE